MSFAKEHSGKVLVFDSGVGGLTIARTIRKILDVDIVYASDNAAFPYGTKTETLLIQRIKTVLTAIQAKAEANIIVIACNTASTVALPALREHFTVPIIGVVPAIKPAAQLSQNKMIGLLATPGTISRRYTHELLENFASHCNVIPIGSSELVHIAEDKLAGKPVDIEQLSNIVKPFQEASLDTVVLACTHFPLLRDELQSLLPNIKYWVDSGDAIARRVQYWLEQLNLKHSNVLTTNHQSYFTQIISSDSQLVKILKNDALDNTTIIDLPFD